MQGKDPDEIQDDERRSEDSAMDGAPPGDGGANELAAARAEADHYHKNWQRSAADFANYKRRVEQERTEVARLANATLVINLLPILDDMDRAAHNVDAGLAGMNWVQGMLAIHRKLASLLESMGVSEIVSEGKHFDPEEHEAVGRQPGDEGAILHVVQKGYRLGDRVLRPTLVIVGDGRPIENQPVEDST